MNQVTSEEDFSLIVGGPMFQFFRRAYLTGDGLELLRRRIAILVLISWLPPLVISSFEGHAWGSSVNLTFLKDIDAHVRFLIALPLVIGRNRRSSTNGRYGQKFSRSLTDSHGSDGSI